MDLSTVNGGGLTSTPPVAATSSTGTGINSDYSTFLKMLTTQMQNQDPLNPIESADFAVQLATFSGVEQQVQTNQLLGSLSTQMGAMGMAQLAGWVGMEARAVAPAHYTGEPVSFLPDPDTTADSARVVVRNALGNEVANFPIPISKDPVNWSGLGGDGTPMPDGLYSFQVESSKAGALLNTRQAEIYAPITEARLLGGETSLVLAGGAQISASAVTALRSPKS